MAVAIFISTDYYYHEYTTKCTPCSIFGWSTSNQSRPSYSKIKQGKPHLLSVNQSHTDDDTIGDNSEINNFANDNVQPSLAFNKTLQFITAIKLQELEKQQLAYQTHAKIIQEAKNASSDLARVELLLNAVHSWSGPGAVGSLGVVGSSLYLSNLSLWILQAKSDPSFDFNIVKG
jgi:hypothetical protein